MKNWTKKFRIPPGKRIRLEDWPTAGGDGMEKSEARRRLEIIGPQMADWQHRLYAEQRRAVLVVLQAMDAGGKDGVIRRVFTFLNPQGCRVTSFKTPTPSELAHDFLWRIHQAVPARGEVGVFNRSHYEDVLIVRVQNLVRQKVWEQRYDQINDFERMLTENGTAIFKFILHISREEQRQRLEERLRDPSKHWKADPADARERECWDDYIAAYEDAIERCGTPWAPWHVIPADRKWFRDLAIAEIFLEGLRSLRPQYPPPKVDLSKIVIR